MLDDLGPFCCQNSDCPDVGKRTTEATHTLVRDFRRRTGNRVIRLMTSDEYPVYEDAIREADGQRVTPPRTGRRGRPRPPYTTVTPEVSYATVHKKRQNNRACGAGEYTGRVRDAGAGNQSPGVVACESEREHGPGGAAQRDRSIPVPPIPGVSFDHHNLLHHGQDPEKLKQLAIVETKTFELLADLLAKLKASKEDGATVLDRTTVMFGSNMSSGNSHSCKNLPIVLAGGGFKHGSHLAFDAKNGPPMANLFVSMLQRLGLEIDKFGTSKGTLTGLEMAG
jgi:hypothetical protein